MKQTKNKKQRQVTKTMAIISKIKLMNAMIAADLGVMALAKSGVQQPQISKFLQVDSKCQLMTLKKLATALNVEPTTLLADNFLKECF